MRLSQISFALGAIRGDGPLDPAEALTVEQWDVAPYWEPETETWRIGVPAASLSVTPTAMRYTRLAEPSGLGAGDEPLLLSPDGSVWYSSSVQEQAGGAPRTFSYFNHGDSPGFIGIYYQTSGADWSPVSADRKTLNIPADTPLVLADPSTGTTLGAPVADVQAISRAAAGDAEAFVALGLGAAGEALIDYSIIIDDSATAQRVDISAYHGDGGGNRFNFSKGLYTGDGAVTVRTHMAAPGDTVTGSLWVPLHRAGISAGVRLSNFAGDATVELRVRRVVMGLARGQVGPRSAIPVHGVPITLDKLRTVWRAMDGSMHVVNDPADPLTISDFGSRIRASFVQGTQPADLRYGMVQAFDFTRNGHDERPSYSLVGAVGGNQAYNAAANLDQAATVVFADEPETPAADTVYLGTTGALAIRYPLDFREHDDGRAATIAHRTVQVSTEATPGNLYRLPTMALDHSAPLTLPAPDVSIFPELAHPDGWSTPVHEQAVAIAQGAIWSEGAQYPGVGSSQPIHGGGAYGREMAAGTAIAMAGFLSDSLSTAQKQALGISLMQRGVDWAYGPFGDDRLYHVPRGANYMVRQWSIVLAALLFGETEPPALIQNNADGSVRRRASMDAMIQRLTPSLLSLPARRVGNVQTASVPFHGLWADGLPWWRQSSGGGDSPPSTRDEDQSLGCRWFNRGYERIMTDTVPMLALMYRHVPGFSDLMARPEMLEYADRWTWGMEQVFRPGDGKGDMATPEYVGFYRRHRSHGEPVYLHLRGVAAPVIYPRTAFDPPESEDLPFAQRPTILKQGVGGTIDLLREFGADGWLTQVDTETLTFSHVAQAVPVGTQTTAAALPAGISVTGTDLVIADTAPRDDGAFYQIRATNASGSDEGPVFVKVYGEQYQDNQGTSYFEVPGAGASRDSMAVAVSIRLNGDPANKPLISSPDLSAVFDADGKLVLTQPGAVTPHTSSVALVAGDQIDLLLSHTTLSTGRSIAAYQINGGTPEYAWGEAGSGSAFDASDMAVLADISSTPDVLDADIAGMWTAHGGDNAEWLVPSPNLTGTDNERVFRQFFHPSGGWQPGFERHLFDVNGTMIAGDADGASYGNAAAAGDFGFTFSPEPILGTEAFSVWPASTAGDRTMAVDAGTGGLVVSLFSYEDQAGYAALELTARVEWVPDEGEAFDLPRLTHLFSDSGRLRHAVFDGLACRGEGTLRAYLLRVGAEGDDEFVPIEEPWLRGTVLSAIPVTGAASIDLRGTNNANLAPTTSLSLPAARTTRNSAVIASVGWRGTASNPTAFTGADLIGTRTSGGASSRAVSHAVASITGVGTLQALPDVVATPSISERGSLVLIEVSPPAPAPTP